MALCVHLGLKLRNYSLGSSAVIRNTKFNYNPFIYNDDVTYWVHTSQFQTPPSRLHCTCTLKSWIWNLVKACLYLLVFCTLELRFQTGVPSKVSYCLSEQDLEKLLKTEKAKAQTGLLRYSEGEDRAIWTNLHTYVRFGSETLTAGNTCNVSASYWIRVY